MRAIEAARTSARLDREFGRLRASDGNHSFTLRDGRGRAIARSQGYPSRSVCEEKPAAVKRAASSAMLEDCTAPHVPR